MEQSNNKFVYSKIDLKVSDDIMLEENDVGAIESRSNDAAEIFFIRIWKKISLNNDDFTVFDVTKTGDGFPKKICNVCHKLLDTALFAKNQNGKNNRSVRRPSCNTCRKIIDGMRIKHKVKSEWGKKKPMNVPFCDVSGNLSFF